MWLKRGLVLCRCTVSEMPIYEMWVGFDFHLINLPEAFFKNFSECRTVCSVISVGIEEKLLHPYSL